MKKHIYILTLMIIAAGLSSQDISDAVRWSSFQPGGTARTLGVGGAFGAMGGDYSVVNINPAGIGEYRKSEFSFSPSLTLSDTKSKLVGSDISTGRQNTTFGVDNVSLVFANRPMGSNWVHSNFAIGFSKVADFNNSYSYSGVTPGSITTNLAQRANQKGLDDLDNFYAWPAYEVGAIYDEGEDLNYETDFAEDEMVNKAQSINQSGYINEINFAWGGNYQDKLNFGLSVGVPFGTFEQSKSYEETDPDNSNPIFNSLGMSEYLNTSAVGVNAKLGLTYKPMKALRLAGALHSRTYYRHSDSYTNTINYSYVDTDGINQSKSSESPSGSFDYHFRTPWKAVGSIGSILSFGKIKGFVNADVELSDYSTSRFDFTPYAENSTSELVYTNEQNDILQSDLGRSVTTRIGGEFAYEKLRLRAGVEQAGSPYAGDDSKRRSTSFGLGLREEKFFLDIGYRMTSFEDGYTPYLLIDSDLEPLVERSTKSGRIVMTAGFKF